jgi:hypothetical protein
MGVREAEAGVRDDALQLELQFESLDRGGRVVEAQRRVDDLSHLRHRFADALLPVGQPGTAQLLHTYTNAIIRHQQTAPLPGTVGRVTGEARRLGKAGAAGDMMGEKLLPGEERCYQGNRISDLGEELCEVSVLPAGPFDFDT